MLQEVFAMTRRVMLGLTVLALAIITVPAIAQDQGELLDVFTVQVKPEKRAAFDAITKRIAEANRKNNGDSWVTTETVYGEGNTVNFISVRKGYGDIENAMGAFMGALAKTYGQAGTEKMMAEASACMENHRSELRRRRWDLSSNVPSDAAGRAKVVGESRWLRTTMVRVRPGRTAEFEALVKEVKAAREKASSDVVFVSQGVAGQQGSVYYVTALKGSLADFDSFPPMQQVLGEEGYERWLKTNADIVLTTQSSIMRFVPESSNAPSEIASAAPSFWNPKPTMARKPGKAATPARAPE
jgi:hypothetical protein